MSSKRRSLLLATLGLLTACAIDAPTAPVLGPSLQSAKSVATVPAGGKCTTTFTTVGFEFPFATIDIDGVCKLKHLGLTTMHSTQLLNVTNGDLTNSTTYTAANGDQLVTSFVGSSTPPPNVVFSGIETYAGGTGRFAGATGSSDLSGTASVALDGSGTGEYTTAGSIRY